MNDANNNDLSILMKRKIEILQRIEENKRLMELIRNPHIKDTLGPAILMKKNMAVKKIQRYWRKKRKSNKVLKRLESNLQINHDKSKISSRLLKSKSILNFKKEITETDVNNNIIKIQRAFRSYLSYKSKHNFTQLYVNNWNREFLEPLKFDRVSQIKTEIVNRIKSKEMPTKNTDFQEILNEYYAKYKQYNEEFPDYMKTRSENLSKYYQCMSLVNYMSIQNNLDNIDKFDEFYINKTGEKKESIEKNFNNIINSIEHKMWWYKYRHLDDFEENNIVNEIDSYCQFSRFDDILSKK